ncbi:MAG: CbrC family protein [Bacillus sp. (in: firmicutes)]
MENIIDINKLPKFKYHPNVYQCGVVKFSNNICECCGRTVDAYIERIYSEEDVECICLDCIASGKAAEKFDGSFIQDADSIDNPEATEELFCRTPGYESWQGENWKACCNDYCAYLGTVGTKELEKMGIADELFEEDGSFDGWDDARKYLVKDGSMCGYLFQCLHCGKYHLVIDTD